MGVPGFFAWLLKKYKVNKMIVNSLPDDIRIDMLYIDANCLFHPQCFKLLKHLPDWSSVDSLHTKMIKRIINYLEYIIQISNPKKGVMIAVDGVAPMAKMNQQRLRRYRSIDNLVFSENLRKKHNKHVPKRWSNTVITPGTEFMEQLHNELLKFIAKQKMYIKYSSYHTVGEGEHKIMADIRHRMKSNMNDVYCVYGLDADLIFLTWACKKKNMYLLREAYQFGSNAKHSAKYEVIDPILDVEEDLNFVSIDEMKNCFIDQCVKLAGKDFKIDKNNKKMRGRLYDDFIFICYFLGNDFLPHLPSVDVNISGLDIVLRAYFDTLCTLKTHLVNIEQSPIVNSIFLEDFLKYLSDREDYYFKKLRPKWMHGFLKRRCPFNDSYDRECWEIANMRSKEADKIRKNNPIKLGEGKRNEWKFRYYEHYFGIETNQIELVEDMCHEFCKGLLWSTKYYFEGCPSWSWKYPFAHAPFISDIYMYVKNSKIEFDDIKIKDDGYLLPCQQLLAVLPPSCSNLLPNTYKHLVLSDKSTIIDMFPEKVSIDMLYKYRDFQCTPNIPQVEQLRIKSATKNLKLSKKEKTRNTVVDAYEKPKK
jgi:5'-3' exonuclease